MSPAFPLFSLGVLLGAATAWFGFRPASAPPPAAPAAAAPMVLPTWSWRESASPSALAGDTATAAIDAWLGLRGPDGGPAGFAVRADALRALLVRLPFTAFPRLLTPLGDAARPDGRRLRQIAFDVWVAHDPAAAARWAVSGRDTSDLARQAVRAWAAIAPLAASEWACGLPDSEVRRDLAREALLALARNDPSRALGLATAQGEAFLDGILPSLMEPLAKTDPAAALRTYGPRLWKKGRGFWALREPLSAWTLRDPSAAFGWLLAQPRSGDDELSDWLGNLANDEKDQRAIATALATVPGLPNRQASLGHLLFFWGSEHPDEALAWLDALPDRNLRTALLERAAHITLNTNPEKSLPLALAMSEGANRTQRLSDLLSKWAVRDPAAALAWIGAHNEPGVAEASADAHAAILGSIARDEPATAVAEWNTIAEARTKAAAILPIAASWARTDPGAALRWASEQEAALKVDRIHDSLIYAWSKNDPLAALRWAEAQTDASRRERYLASLAGTWKEKAPRAATADLFAQIQDPTLRTSILTNHLREWLSKDRPAAQAWLESHDALTPARAAALLAQP